MKRAAGCFIVLLFAFSALLHAQQVNEKQLTFFPKSKVMYAYDIRYDAKTGSYAYTDYDTVNSAAYVVTPKGKSKKFLGANTYFASFDEAGNVFYVGYDNLNDSEYVYSMMKNNEVVGTYTLINDYWVIKNGTLYFEAKEGGKDYFMAYDIASGSISKSKPYDEVHFVYIPEQNYRGHGEPPAYPGFTNDGKPYFAAMKDSMYFMVVGGVEQKMYKDLDIYNVSTDKSGEPVYMASDSGSIYSGESSNVCLVRGKDEYKKYAYLYSPVLFDNSNMPVYVAGSKPIGSNYPQFVVSGNEVISKEYNGGVSDLQYTPSGKLAFVVNELADSLHTNSYIIIDGKQGSRHNSIYNLSFLPGDVPMYLESKGSKQFLAKGTEKLSGLYDYIPYYNFSAGRLVYAGTNYTGDGGDKTYVFVNDEKFGPFTTFLGDESPASDIIKVDDAGNYAFLGTKVVDAKNYIYETYVYTNDEKEGPYSQVDNLALYKGKALYTGRVEKKKGNDSVPSSKIFYGTKEITKSYDLVSYYNFDSAKGLISFTATRGDNVYYLEIKL